MSNSDCNDASCGCRTELPRRDFLRLAGIASLGVALGGGRAFAGPFHRSDFQSSDIPSDKKLGPEWVRSLYARGEAKTYRGPALAHIGMPVGGICAGMVYLAGDGKLWHWDIFNQNKTGISQTPASYRGRELSALEGSAYVKPLAPDSEVHQGFWASVDEKRRSLEVGHWSDIGFQGQYPIGRVSYKDSDTKVTVEMEAFSPFIPLNEDDSGLPITLVTLTARNHEDRAVEVELGGFLSNPIGMYSCLSGEIQHVSEPLAHKGLSGTLLRVRPLKNSAHQTQDLDVEIWAHDTYVGWTVEGAAFGVGPVAKANIPSYQGDVGGPGDRVVNTHASAPGSDVPTRDSATGKLTGTPFTIQRKFLNFWIGGGDHPGQTCINLVADGKVVRTGTGHDSNQMRIDSFSVADLVGKTVHLEIVDAATSAWGNIGVGRIWQSDQAANSVPLLERPDVGTMAIACFNKESTASEELVDTQSSATVKKRITLKPGDSTEVTFAIAWHFPNLKLGIPDDSTRRHYAKRFADAGDVMKYAFDHRDRLMSETREWNRTWYDSTLPYWFLDRTFANTSTLATTTCHRFGSGRFYAWEGVGCCAGTCTHVWHYAQAVGRLFPALERDLRERVDYGVGFHPDTGAIGFRAEFDTSAAVDGQAGSILRTLREHQMCADSAFLTRVWPRAKQALQYLMRMDPHGEGILEGPQENTLDAAWYGKIAWTSSLYNAALRAGAEMASEMGDTGFASQCSGLADRGKQSIQTQLFNGEYFFQTKDPAHASALGTYNACHIDQVMGQGWAWQVGLPRVLDSDKTLTALRSLYRYNFTPDVGPFREHRPEGRWYAMPGDGGMIMATNPKGEKNPYGDVTAWQYGYFNECMSGFEHQVAAHMIAEGMVEEGLVLTRAINDRYDASMRNPYNEIECSDHYARAMASYGSFLRICGFEYHGPSAMIGFDPRIAPEAFRCAFTTAEGWGSYEQKRGSAHFEASLKTRWGRVVVQMLKLRTGLTGSLVAEVHLGGKMLKHRIESVDGEDAIVLERPVVVESRAELKVVAHGKSG